MKEKLENIRIQLPQTKNAKIANRGIVVIGSGENVRALMAYGGGSHGGVAYAEAANKYKTSVWPESKRILYGNSNSNRILLSRSGKKLYE